MRMFVVCDAYRAYILGVCGYGCDMQRYSLGNNIKFRE